MYNRYIPQPDGSYSRRRIPEPPAPTPPPRQEHRPREEHWQPEPEKAQHQEETRETFSSGQKVQHRPCRGNSCRSRPPQRPLPPPPKPEPREHRQSSNSHKQETSVLSFLKQLLPKDFDTGDLLIVLLLLLMSGDCQEDQNTAILTLVLYLFM